MLTKYKSSKVLPLLALMSTSVAGAAEAPAGVKVGGFVDAQIHFTNKPANSQGFTVYDGAAYISKEFGAGEVKVDLPFGANGTGADFGVGLAKAQAYVGYKTDMGLKFKLGQFDTIYGFELNDTADVTFSRQGILNANALPVVHAGLLASYDLGGMATINAMVANPKENGRLNTVAGGSVDGGRNLDYGFQVVAAPANFRLGAGILMGKNPVLNATVERQSNQLIDFLAGATFDKLALDAEFVIAKENETTGLEAEGGTGLLVQGVYGFTDMVSGGVRFETINKLTSTQAKGGTADDKVMQITAGPQFALTQDLKLKVDYSYNSNKQGAADAVKSHIYALAGVYKF